MAFEQELDIYLRSRFTLMVLVTPEEERALESVKRVSGIAPNAPVSVGMLPMDLMS